MQALNPNVAEKMRQHAREVRERQASGNFTATWNLSGKKAIVEPGKSVVVRFFPRWDFANSLHVVDGKWVPNPTYERGLDFVLAYEHWLDADGGKVAHEWCPRTLDPASKCPICQVSAAMAASALKEDKEYGKRIGVREVFIFNACVGYPRRLSEDGLVDIRTLSVPGTVYNAVSDIMTGGDQPQYARGDIMHPSEGYDVLLKRPAGGVGDRWSASCVPNPSPLYDRKDTAQVAAFSDWVTRLTNLEDMLVKETKTPADLQRAHFPGGVFDDSPRGVGTQDKPTALQEPATVITSGTSQVDTTTANPPEDPDDEFMGLIPAGKPAGPPPQRVAGVTRAPRR